MKIEFDHNLQGEGFHLRRWFIDESAERNALWHDGFDSGYRLANREHVPHVHKCAKCDEWTGTSEGRPDDIHKGV